MKETFYFSHDYNARSDEKIKRLLVKHGFLGYGVYWAIVEDLYQNANAMRTDYECIAYELRVNEDCIKSIINDFDLFEIEGDVFGSLSVQRRLDERDKKSKKARESALYRWNKNKENANAMRTQCDSNAIKESKGKESKGKESKRKESKRKESIKKDVFTPPQISEVIDYFTEKGYSKQAAEKMFEYYSVADWKDSGGKKVRNWKQKANAVWFKDEHKTKSNAIDYSDNTKWAKQSNGYYVSVDTFDPITKQAYLERIAK